MRARWDHHADAGHRGRSARWRVVVVAAVVVAAAALSLAAGAVPASAAGGYAVTATIPVGFHPDAVAVDPAAGTVYVANDSGAMVSVIAQAITLTNPQPFRSFRISAYQVKVTNTGTAAEPRAIVHVDLARGLWPVRAGGAGWTCRADFFRDTETCVHATPLAPGQPTTFLVQTLVLARPGTVLTSTADVTPADAHASDTTRVQL